MDSVPQITYRRRSQGHTGNTSLHSVDQTLSPPSGNETISNTLHQRLRDDLLSPDNSYCEKEVFEVSLEKQKPYGIGITIVGGDSSSRQDVGLFVKSVTKDGPAFHDGRIKPGDRIIAINSESVDGKEHHEAVKIIKHSKGKIKLLISQIKPPGSIKKRDYDEALFEMKLHESILEHEKDYTDLSSSRNDIDHSSVPTITVRNPSVHSPKTKDKKFNKNIENGYIENHKNIVDAHSSIPKMADEIEDQDVENSTTADVHSTLSLVDSLHSEMVASDIAVDTINDITEVYSEGSDTDSDFDTAVNDVIENRVTYTSQGHSVEGEGHQLPRRDKVLSPITETVEVILEKKNGSFGLNVTGGVTTTVKHGGIYVKSLIENGSAALEGTVKKGDRILEVNDIQLIGYTHKEAVETLVNAPDVTRLLIERPVQTSSRSEPILNPRLAQLKDDLTVRDSPTAGVEVHEMSPGSTINNDDICETVADVQGDLGEFVSYYPFQNDENTFTVELKKGSYGLGFSLFGCEVEDQPSYCLSRIKRVFPIGPAADSKQIQAGDVIIAVNGGDVKGLTHIETMAMIRRAGKTVTLVLCHPDPDVLPPVQNIDSYESLEVTPTSSTSHITDDDDSDSDIEVTPRREALITPPTGFAPSPYPVDEEGGILPKIASPPPPLPISPPPVLINSGNVEPTEEYEIEIPELNESCNSELVYLQNTKLNLQELTNNSLVVREDSALTVSSRDVTPTVVEISRESTPYILESESNTPVNELEENSTLTPREGDLSESEVEQVASPGDTGSFVQTGHSFVSESIETETLDSQNDDLNMSGQSQTLDKCDSDSDSDTHSAILDTNKSTSFSINRLDTTQDDGDSVVDVLDNSLHPEGNSTVDSVDSSDVVNSVDTVDKLIDSSMRDTGITDNDDEDSGRERDERVVDESETDYSDENEELDDTLKQLEEKYKELNDDARSSEIEEERDDDIENEQFDGEITNNVLNENVDEDNEEQEYVDGNDEEQKFVDDDFEKQKFVHDNFEGQKFLYDDNSDDVKEHGFVQDERDDDVDDDDEFVNEKNNDYKDAVSKKFINDDNYDDDSKREHSVNQDSKDDNVQSYDDKFYDESDDDGHDDKDVGKENSSNDVEEISESEDSESDSACVRGDPSLPLQPGDIEVTLTKPEGRGLGFTVAGGAGNSRGCYVKAVLQNPALSDGTLKPGDKLIMVNGIDMRTLTHFDAVSVLREAANDVTVRVHRDECSVGDTGKAGVVKSSHADGLTSEQETEKSQDNNSKVAKPEIRDEEEDSESENEEDLREDLDDEASASDDGADDMQCIQDLIESLTATDTHLEPHDQSVERKELTVGSHNETGYFSQRSPPSSDMSVYQIDLQKPSSGGLGISLVSTETQNQTGVFIRTISPGGVADQDGRLKVGDKILQINGESLIGMNHTKAATILRLSQGKLSITVSRSQNKRLSWMTRQDNVDSVTNGKTENTSVTSEAEESSLSITKHVPDDITDTGVDDLVAEAERILQEESTNMYQNTDEINSSDDETDNVSDNSNNLNKADERSKASYKYLSTSEVIDYAPDKIDFDTENSGSPPRSYSEIHEQKSTKEIISNELRRLDIEVPEEVTPHWLSSVPLVTIDKNFQPVIPEIVAELKWKVDIGDPQQEFRQLRIIPDADECTDASLQHNKPKNRFRNVLPYNTNRVKISDDSRTDYINASHIQYKIGGSICKYIACQGPLPETTDDFWEMTWQQEVTVIAMLTLDMESMKVKCHRYWPECTDTPLDVCNSKYRLTLLYWNNLDDFDIRKILMEDIPSGQSRCVYHVNFTSWPDHGTPSSAVPLLQCVRLCHLLRTTGPMIVHCSAGIGRSGTFITIDIALAHVEKGVKFSIVDIVTELRRQRQGMIQTRDQYLFCYTACLECLELEAGI